MVAKMFGVDQKAARKWLEGEGMPKTSRIPGMSRQLKVRAEWMLTGMGAKKEKNSEEISSLFAALRFLAKMEGFEEKQITTTMEWLEKEYTGLEGRIGMDAFYKCVWAIVQDWVERGEFSESSARRFVSMIESVKK